MILYNSWTAWISDFLACMGSCLGCCTKAASIIGFDEASKGLQSQGWMVKKPSVSEDFWSTSTCDLDCAVQSQRDISSIVVSNQSLNHCSGTGSTSNHSGFVNHGLMLWNQTRVQWIGNRRSSNQEQVQEYGLSWGVSYQSLLETTKRFPQSIPLAEMVDFLVDIWEQDGLYD